MKCPTLDFLDDVEKAFSVAWPASFRAFCRAHEGSELRTAYPSLRGSFIRDLDVLLKTNVMVGTGSWSDYERAITGRAGEKDGHRLYLDLLPFYVEDDDVLGFLTSHDVDTGEVGSDKVVVWAVHTFVHEYPTFADWLLREGASR